MEEDTEFDCPLLKRKIAEGLCIEINMQAVSAVTKEAEVKEVLQSMSIAELQKICEKCGNFER